MRATLHISHGKFPTIENSIPVFNWLMDKIEEFNNIRNINEVIKQAGLKAMEKLKKYYRYTDGTAYTVSTGIFHILIFYMFRIDFLFFNCYYF